MFVCKVSGGVGSYLAMRRVARTYGAAACLAVFTDTLIEDQDAYRFLIASCNVVFGTAAHVPEIEDFPAWEDRERFKAYVVALAASTMAAIPQLRWVSDGRDPWDIYQHERMIGNTRMDPCSKILKRQFSRKWLKANADPEQDYVVVGLDYEEIERFEGDERRKTPGFRRRMLEEGWRALAPLCDAPYLGQQKRLELLAMDGLWVPRLNLLGFAHNNCGGHCCKAGLGHWLLMLKHFPERFYWCAEREKGLLDLLGDPHTMLRDRRGGVTRPLSLYALAAREATPMEMVDMGGCGCFSG